jgi:hypothetical protein
MNTLKSVLCAAIISLLLFSCKNEKSADSTANDAPIQVDNSKVLAGAGAKDISITHKLDQTQIVQEGNIAFNFKSLNSLQVYIKSPQNESLDFNNNEVYAIFADKTIKETSFKVESIDLTVSPPVLNVTSVISKKDVAEYRPSFVVTVPKKDITAMPTIKLDGSVIAVFGME